MQFRLLSPGAFPSLVSVLSLAELSPSTRDSVVLTASMLVRQAHPRLTGCALSWSYCTHEVLYPSVRLPPRPIGHRGRKARLLARPSRLRW